MANQTTECPNCQALANVGASSPDQPRRNLSEWPFEMAPAWCPLAKEK